MSDANQASRFGSAFHRNALQMNGNAGQISVIIPALNEEGSVGALLRAIPTGLFNDVVVVDNGSEDRTAEVARDAGARVVLEPRRGYGQACQAGLRTPGSNSVLNSHACHACLRLRLSPVMCPACHVSYRVTHYQTCLASSLY